MNKLSRTEFKQAIDYAIESAAASPRTALPYEWVEALYEVGNEATTCAVGEFKLHGCLCPVSAASVRLGMRRDEEGYPIFDEGTDIEPRIAWFAWRFDGQLGRDEPYTVRVQEDS